ncbi:MAG TPA: class I SAM-dependent methyltransferase [Dongiaceae bacterium]|nr:class I SAM-dependent methyltransferase [Dongiaceae bacterium]
MNSFEKDTIKKNVNRFEDDVRRSGSYAYTAEKLSSQLANGRISEGISSSYSFAGKRVLDLGCGDGTYTLELAKLGADRILGIDPAEAAVKAASMKAERAGYSDRVQFKVGNIYALQEQLGESHFDCVVLRGVLHHLPDPARAVACIASVADTIVILEPNGYNPVLKLLERFSRYHVEHEEQSFFPSTIKGWATAAGFGVRSARMINLVPMFCPDWMARICRSLQPLAENLPIVRALGCGQCLIVATKFISNGK